LSLTRDHFSPPSSERKSPPSSASIIAYTRWLFDAATPTVTFPYGPFGKPSFFSPGLPVSLSPCPALGGPICFHVSPPSRETNSPLPGPPLVSSHGLRRACHIPAKRIRGLFGSKQTSDAPVSRSLPRTRCHVLPPLVVRYTPRSSFGPNGLPSTAAKAMS